MARTAPKGAKQKERKRQTERLVGARKEKVVDEAEQHMVALLPPSEVMSTVMKDHALTWDQARNVVQAVRARWKLEAAKPEDRKRYKAEQVQRIMGLYRKALDKGQLGVCAKLESLLAKMHGTLEPKKHDHRGLPAPPVRTAAEQDEFDDTSRSISDLDHYAEHGHWPEEGAEGSEIVEAPVDETEEAEFPLH